VRATAGKDGEPAIRTTSGSSDCAATRGSCQSGSSSTADTRDGGTGRDRGWFADPTAADGPAGPELTASSTADSFVDCRSAGCTGTARGATAGEASGDLKGVRDSAGSSDCEARGAGGGCAAHSDTEVSNRQAQTNPDGTPA